MWAIGTYASACISASISASASTQWKCLSMIFIIVLSVHDNSLCVCVCIMCCVWCVGCGVCGVCGVYVAWLMQSATTVVHGVSKQCTGDRNSNRLHIFLGNVQHMTHRLSHGHHSCCIRHFSLHRSVWSERAREREREKERERERERKREREIFISFSLTSYPIPHVIRNILSLRVRAIISVVDYQWSSGVVECSNKDSEKYR